jgi:hypothetical protein
VKAALVLGVVSGVQCLFNQAWTAQVFHVKIIATLETQLDNKVMVHHSFLIINLRTVQDMYIKN